ncbi:MAG: hypothetical protein JXB35_13885, partial [Anaerolineae bacterium]|nr:hypothetical protein [Anaerolineae bacterium]
MTVDMANPWQLIAWFVALLDFILALYLLVLNFRNLANLHISALLLFFSVNIFGLGWLIGARDATQAAAPTVLLSATSAMTQPALLLAAIVLFRPEWFTRA